MGQLVEDHVQEVMTKVGKAELMPSGSNVTYAADPKPLLDL